MAIVHNPIEEYGHGDILSVHTSFAHLAPTICTEIYSMYGAIHPFPAILVVAGQILAKAKGKMALPVPTTVQ